MSPQSQVTATANMAFPQQIGLIQLCKYFFKTYNVIAIVNSHTKIHSMFEMKIDDF